MIYLFSWNHSYLVREKTLVWKQKYIERYGDLNLVHFKNLKEVDNNVLSQELLSNAFMGWKKLIIIDDFPLSSSNKEKDLILKQEFLYALLDKIPQDNIVVFSSVNPDKRSKFYKKIKKIAFKIEEFESWTENNIFNIISKKYAWKIDSSAINLIIKYKSNNLDKIISEIEKLLILNQKIDVNLVKKYIFPELEESIFQLIDDIMNCNKKEALKKMNIILSQVNIYAFYNNLLANLKVLVFIALLKNKNIWNIAEILDLKNRAFLINKNYRISFEKLNNLYIWLINLDKKMKSWKMIWSEELVLKYEIQKELLKN